MAKRIKVKGNTPRGLSKAQRIVRGADATFKGESRLVNKRRERENYKGELVGMPDRIADSHIETLAGLRDYAHLSPEARRGQTKPSSTRKNRVKEGNRKFIGPRTLRSVEEQHGADEDRNFGLGGPVPDRNNLVGKIRGSRFKEISQPDFESIGSEQLKEILMKVLYERGLRMPF